MSWVHERTGDHTQKAKGSIPKGKGLRGTDDLEELSQNELLRHPTLMLLGSGFLFEHFGTTVPDTMYSRLKESSRNISVVTSTSETTR